MQSQQDGHNFLSTATKAQTKIKRAGGWDLSLEKSSQIGGWIVERVNVPYIMIAQLHLGSIF